MPWLAAIPALAGLASTGISAGLAASGGSGEKVQVPGVMRTDPQAEQMRTVFGNRTALPSIAGLSADINAVSQEQLMQILRSGIPQYDTINNLGAKNLVAGLKGELTDETKAGISRLAAERSAAGGFKGSQFAGNLGLRDLGRSIDDRQQWATAYAPNWLASTKATSTARQFDPASMFVSPAMQIGNEQQNNQSQYSRDLYAAQMAAAPDPTAAALAKLTGGVGGALASYGFSSMGGGGGGGVGSPGWGGISGYGGNTYYPNAGGTSYSARS